MSSFRMKTKPAEDSQNVSIIGPANSSSNSKKIDSSTIDDLVTQCENLLRNNFSKYDICIKYQEKLRLQLIKADEDFKFIRAWLETANEDCLRMKSNDDYLTNIFEILLRNNFVNDFVEHGVGREKLNLKFLSAMIQIKDLRKNLSTVEDNMALVRTDYEEMQYREVLMQITHTEESLEFAEFQKNLRFKSVNVMDECDRLSKSLIEVCEHIITLKSTHDDLIRSYGVLLEDTTVKTFLNYIKQRENPQLESAEKRQREKIQKESSSYNFSIAEKFATKNEPNQISSVKIHSAQSSSNTPITFISSSVSEPGFSKLKDSDSCENVACQEKLTAEQRRREQIEKEYSSLGEFSDKLCSLLLKYQHLSLKNERTEKFAKNDSIQNSSVKRNSVSFNTQISEECSWFSVSEICATDIKEENIEKLDLGEDELHLDAKSNSAPSSSNAIISKMSATVKDEENNKDMDAYESGYHFLISCFENGSYFPVSDNKRNSDNSLDHHSESHFDNYDFANKFDSASSNEATYAAGDLIGEHQNRIKIVDSIGRNQLLSSSDQIEFRQAPISTSTGRKRCQTTNQIYHCKKCDKSFVLKKNKFKRKCPTCGARNISVSRETSIVPNSSVTSFLCNICNRYYANKSNLRTHKRLVHEGLREFKCSICGKMLSTKQSLTLHMANHSSLRPYKCPFCNHCYPHPTLVKKHARKTHNKKISYSYEQSYKFSSRGSQFLKKKCRKKDSLQRAESRSSTTQKTLSTAKNSYDSKLVENSSELGFQCDICDRYFVWERSLKEHKRSIHEGHKDYKCPVCGKIFTRIHDRYRHWLSHTSLCPYKCPLCSKSFKNSKSVNWHTRKYHGIDPKTLKKNRQKIIRNISKTNLRNIQKIRNVARKNVRTIQNNGDILTKKLKNISNIKKRYCCAHCGQRFYLKQSMFHHICMEHFSGKLEHFKCTSCKHVFPTNQYLICHRQAYHSKKNRNK